MRDKEETKSSDTEMVKPVVRRWLAAYTRMHHERKVSALLDAMGIENFVAMQEEVHQWKDRRKKVMRILLPMVVFVRVDEIQQKEVLTLASVSRYMVALGKRAPLVIPDNQMDRFRFVLDCSEATVSISNESFEPGDMVNVIKGPLRGLQAEFVKNAGKTQIVICLGALGNAFVEIPIGYVELVK